MLGDKYFSLVYHDIILELYAQYVPTNNTTETYEGNLACVAMSENPVHLKISRHIDIRRYFVRELVKTGFVKLIPSRTNKMVADALRCPQQEPAFACLHRPPPCHDGPNVLWFEVLALLMYLWFLFNLFKFFFMNPSRYIFFGLSHVYYEYLQSALERAAINHPSTTQS